jgi:hypothetical protein
MLRSSIEDQTVSFVMMQLANDGPEDTEELVGVSAAHETAARTCLARLAHVNATRSLVTALLAWHEPIAAQCEVRVRLAWSRCPTCCGCGTCC